MNLLSNALKFTQVQGQITIKVQVLEIQDINERIKKQLERNKIEKEIRMFEIDNPRKSLTSLVRKRY